MLPRVRRCVDGAAWTWSFRYNDRVPSTACRPPERGTPVVTADHPEAGLALRPAGGAARARRRCSSSSSTPTSTTGPGQAGALPVRGHAAARAASLGLDGMVSWFFVLSAFLLAAAVRPRRAGRAAVPRRRAPSWPAGPCASCRCTSIAVSVVWAWRNPGLPGDWRDLLLHLTFTQELRPERIFYTIGPAWSLAVEVQFYVLLAVLGGAGRRGCGTRLADAARPAGAAVGGHGVAGAGVRRPGAPSPPLVLEQPATDDSTLVLAARQARSSSPPASPWRCWYVSRPGAAAGGAAPGCCASGRCRRGRRGHASPAQFTGGAARPSSTAVCGVGFALLVLAVRRRPAAPASGTGSLSGRVLVWLRHWCRYSLYLWHEPLLLGLAGLGPGARAVGRGVPAHGRACSSASAWSSPGLS